MLIKIKKYPDHDCSLETFLVYSNKWGHQIIKTVCSVCGKTVNIVDVRKSDGKINESGEL